MAYTSVSLTIDGIKRSIVCESPEGSDFWSTLYNLCFLLHSQKKYDLGPVDESVVQSVVVKWLDYSVYSKKQVPDDVKMIVLRTFTNHKQLIVSPDLTGPAYFHSRDLSCLFQVFRFQLLHGWVLDPLVSSNHSVITKTREELLQYRDELENQEVHAEELEVVRGLLRDSENYVTDYGFRSLLAEIEEDKFAAVFCYNRLRVVLKRRGKLFILESSLAVRQQFPGVVWRYFDGGALEDNILLTEAFAPVAGQPNFDDKCTRWASAISIDAIDESSENSSQPIKLSKSQRKKLKIKEKRNAKASSDREQIEVTAREGSSNNDQGHGTQNEEGVQSAAKAKDIDDAAEVVTKGDSKKNDAQASKQKGNKPSVSAQVIPKKGEEDLGTISLVPGIALPQGIDNFPAEGQFDVSDFMEFLLSYELDGGQNYFRGILKAFEVHLPWFFVPYEFILAYNKTLALKIQDHYPSICEELKKSVIQYLQMHNVNCSDVSLKIFGLPKPKSVQLRSTDTA